MSTPQTDRTQTAVIVLAAGSGTRMKSTTPKMLHRVCGRTMLGHALHAAAQVVTRASVRATLTAESVSTPAGTWRSYREAFPSALR